LVFGAVPKKRTPEGETMGGMVGNAVYGATFVGGQAHSIVQNTKRTVVVRGGKNLKQVPKKNTTKRNFQQRVNGEVGPGQTGGGQSKKKESQRIYSRVMTGEKGKG